MLPFLHDGRLVARLDLKADRQSGRLLVRGSFAEPTWDQERDQPELVARLNELADFLGLAEVEVEKRGDLAASLM